MNWKALVDQARPRAGMTVTRDNVLYSIAEVHSDCLVLVRNWREKPGAGLQTETLKVPYSVPT